MRPNANPPIPAAVARGDSCGGAKRVPRFEWPVMFAALPMLKRRSSRPPGGAEPTLNATLRWWLGELLLELDRSREAEVYFKSVGEHTYLPSIWAWYRLGRIYEKLGRQEEAREAFATFAAGWRDADPELQPLVEEARAAAKRLTSVARE
jgi:tetratricopeptide (TPR) repeat protein